MKFTGERYIPDEFNDSEYISQMHLKRYEFAIPFIKGKDVIDIACGEGYGSNKMSEFSKTILGIDIDSEVINYAKDRYKKNNIRFYVGSVEMINEPNQSVDVVISFETIEHVGRKIQKKFLKEVIRVLRPGGLFIVSTPDKDISGEGHNEFHVCEMNKKGLCKLLSNYFYSIELYGQDIRKYGNKTFLFLIRVLHKLIKLDRFKIRHKIFPKKLRSSVDSGIIDVATVGTNKENDLFPTRISDDETAMFLVAVCKKK